jgi:hypothetical protein
MPTPIAPAELGVTHVIVALHLITVPIIEPLGGRPLVFSRFDRRYLDRLQRPTHAAIKDAVTALAGCSIYASLELPVEGFARHAAVRLRPHAVRRASRRPGAMRPSRPWSRGQSPRHWAAQRALSPTIPRVA